MKKLIQISALIADSLPYAQQQQTSLIDLKKNEVIQKQQNYSG